MRPAKEATARSNRSGCETDAAAFQPRRDDEACQYQPREHGLNRYMVFRNAGKNLNSGRSLAIVRVLMQP